MKSKRKLYLPDHSTKLAELYILRPRLSQAHSHSHLVGCCCWLLLPPTTKDIYLQNTVYAAVEFVLFYFRSQKELKLVSSFNLTVH